ncbi:MAG: hypothetical protein HEP80_01225 [Dolichospermum sp. UKL201]|nr:MAG: hypothetical protein HEP80_01225 [Dolichospermum sp. UKL201]
MILGEHLNPATLVGGGFVIGGIGLTNTPLVSFSRLKK